MSLFGMQFRLQAFAGSKYAMVNQTSEFVLFFRQARTVHVDGVNRIEEEEWEMVLLILLNCSKDPMRASGNFKDKN